MKHDNIEKCHLFHEISDSLHEISNVSENSHLFQSVKIVTIFKIA